jgi:hypothetical protein
MADDSFRSLNSSLSSASFTGSSSLSSPLQPSGASLGTTSSPSLGSLHTSLCLLIQLLRFEVLPKSTDPFRTVEQAGNVFYQRLHFTPVFSAMLVHPNHLEFIETLLEFVDYNCSETWKELKAPQLVIDIYDLLFWAMFSDDLVAKLVVDRPRSKQLLSVTQHALRV